MAIRVDITGMWDLGQPVETIKIDASRLNLLPQKLFARFEDVKCDFFVVLPDGSELDVGSGTLTRLRSDHD